MIICKNDKKIDFNRLIDMFNDVGWVDNTVDLIRLKDMVENSQIVITAWDDDYMIGFARCTTDFVFNGQINNVVVDLKYRKRGIGKKLVSAITDTNQRVTYIFRGDDHNEGFYGKLGFELAERTFVYKRKK